MKSYNVNKTSHFSGFLQERDENKWLDLNLDMRSPDMAWDFKLAQKVWLGAPT